VSNAVAFSADGHRLYAAGPAASGGGFIIQTWDAIPRTATLITGKQTCWQPWICNLLPRSVQAVGMAFPHPWSVPNGPPTLLRSTYPWRAAVTPVFLLPSDSNPVHD